MKKTGLLFSAIVALQTACHSPSAIVGSNLVNPYRYEIQKQVSCRNGAVVSAHPLASAVGLAMLREGGNAVDAAIATQLALAVVYPGAGNIGGGGFTVAHLADGRNISIDYREKAPVAATRDMYLDKDGNAVAALSQDGHLASGVPGSVAGLFAAYRYARLPFRKLIQPAIDLAEKGFVISASEARSLNANQKEFRQFNTVMPVFVREKPWKAGDTLVQKDLAATLKRIRDNGKAGFYEGETARLIAEEMKRGHGLIGLADLKAYEAVERQPAVSDYRGFRIVTMPLPSSGGVLLPQMLKMVESRPMAEYGFHTVKSVQLMIEVERRAYADRARFLGDVDFYPVPVKTLTSDDYIKERMKDYDPEKAGSSTAIGAGTIPEHEETTHFSVYDSQGNAVAVTTTLNGGYGCRTVVGGAGFLLNNEMDDFSAKPGVPNMYGAVGAAANAIAPGKRMLSSMTPTIVLRQNKPYLVVGTPGGTTITTSVFQTIVNLIDFGMSPDDAVNQPKFHHQWLPDLVYVEQGFSQALQDSLTQMGYKLVRRGQIGRTEVIQIGEDGHIVAVGDHRGDDDAEGY